MNLLVRRQTWKKCSRNEIRGTDWVQLSVIHWKGKVYCIRKVMFPDWQSSEDGFLGHLFDTRSTKFWKFVNPFFLSKRLHFSTNSMNSACQFYLWPRFWFCSSSNAKVAFPVPPRGPVFVHFTQISDLVNIKVFIYLRGFIALTWFFTSNYNVILLDSLVIIIFLNICSRNFLMVSMELSGCLQFFI